MLFLYVKIFLNTNVEVKGNLNIPKGEKYFVSICSSINV